MTRSTRRVGGTRGVGRAAAWPSVGTRALLTPVGGAPRPTWVEDATDTAVAVAVPRQEKGELEPPEDGAPFELSWPGPRGLVRVPVVLRGRVRDGAVPLWWFEPAGPAGVQQRRSHVRAEVEAPFPVRVALAWEVPERGLAHGELQDLSEGGLRTHLSGDGALACPEGAGVSVLLTLVDVAEPPPASGGAPGASGGAGVDVVEHELFGTVVRAGRLAEDGDAVEVVVQLHDDPSQADALRRLVFAWQRRARRR